MSDPRRHSAPEIQGFLHDEWPLDRFFQRLYAEPEELRQSFEPASQAYEKAASRAIERFGVQWDACLLHDVHREQLSLTKFSVGNLAIDLGRQSTQWTAAHQVQCDVSRLLGEARGTLSVRSESTKDSTADCHFYPKALSAGSDVVRNIRPRSATCPDSRSEDIFFQKIRQIADVQPTGLWQRQIPVMEGTFIWQRWIFLVCQSLLRHCPNIREQASGNRSSYDSFPGSQGSSASQSGRDQAVPDGNGDEDERIGDGDTGGGGDGGGDPQSGTLSELPARRLACPYHKRNPHMHSRPKSCGTSQWSEVRRIKDHIYRRHLLPISCPRCWASFKAQSELDKHLLLPERCQVRVGVPLEGCTKEQKAALKEKRRNDKRSEEEKWVEMYKILFPDDDHANIPSPYFETWQDAREQELAQREQELTQREQELTQREEELAQREQELAQRERFVRLEVPREVPQHFEEGIFQLPTQIQQHCRTIMDMAVNNTQRNEFELYPRERLLVPSAAIALSPSSVAALPPGTLESDSTRGDSLSNQGNTEVTSETTTTLTTLGTDFDFPNLCDPNGIANEELVEVGYANSSGLDLRPSKRVKHQHDESGEEAVRPFFPVVTEGEGAAGFSTENGSEENLMSPSDLLPEEDTDWFEATRS